MRVGFVLCGNEEWPSARIAGFNLVRELQKRSVKAEVIFFPKRESSSMPDLSEKIRGFDIIVFQKKGGPGFVKTLEGCVKLGVKTVYHCSDNIPTFLRNGSDCDIIVVPSKNLRNSLAHCRVVWVPDAYEEFESLSFKHEGKAYPVWFGTEAGFGALRDLVPFECFTVGRKPWADVNWSLEEMNRLRERGNVVVVPQFRDDFNIMKSPGRVVQARAMGFPVIASPLPSYVEIPGVLFAEKPSEWVENLEKLDDPEARQRLAAEGADEIRMRFSMEQICNRWLAVFFSLLGSQRATRETQVGVDLSCSRPSISKGERNGWSFYEENDLLDQKEGKL